MKAKSDWPEEFYRNSFYNPASAEAIKAAPAEAAFLIEKLKLKKGASLLDLCCGPGRHALIFAKRGLNVTGYDFSAEYLAEAKAKAEKKKLAVRFEQGDMRHIPYKNAFDAAVNLFNSFGYFLNQEEDFAVLQGLFSALKPGGMLAIDIVNGTYMRNYAGPYSRTDLGSSLLIEEREFSKEGMTCAWTFMHKKTGKSRSAVFFNRLYSRKTLAELLEKAGFRILSFFGDFSGARLTDKKDRIIAIARKPARPEKGKK